MDWKSNGFTITSFNHLNETVHFRWGFFFLPSSNLFWVFSDLINKKQHYILEGAHQKQSSFYRTRSCLKWELYTKMQQSCTGKVGNTGKSHSAAFTNISFLWAVLCPQNTSMDVEIGRLPFLLHVSYQSREDKHTLSLPPQLPGTFLHYETLHKSVPCKTKMN